MNPANLLTILRIFLVPVLILLILYGHLTGALIVFLLAGMTDLLDGLIARRFDQSSPLGTMLDPIADKVLLVSSFVALSLPTAELTVRIPLWLTVSVISRDILLITGVVIIHLALGSHVFPPSSYGKWTTAFQLLTVFLVLLGNSFQYDNPLLPFVLYATLALTLISGVHYALRGAKLSEYGQGKFE
ncbi:MAG: CDP-alcohol phosphatidyltransferase family protein [Acidobacteriota bacterium]